MDEGTCRHPVAHWEDASLELCRWILWTWQSSDPMFGIGTAQAILAQGFVAVLFVVFCRSPERAVWNKQRNQSDVAKPVNASRMGGRRRSRRVPFRVSRKPVRRKLCRTRVLVSHPQSCSRQFKPRFPVCIEREKKQLVAADEAVKVALQNRDECLDVLAQGERWLEELQAQEKSLFAPVPDPEAELGRLRAQVAELQESTRVVERRSVQRVSPAMAMPASVPAELSVWDGRSAGGHAGSTHERRTTDVSSKLSSLLTKGSRAFVGDDSNRTSQMTNFGLAQVPERVSSPLIERRAHIKTFSQVRSQG